MKSLPQIVDDMRTNAAFLMELAGQIEEVANFFGGGPKPVAQPTPAPIPIAVAPVVAAPEQPKAKRGCEPGRKLTKDEKAAVRADWTSIPKALRTPTNRAALLLKHRITGQQFHALTREDNHLQTISKLRYANAATPQS